ncbi:MAG TPA: response regulator [Phototrophicaceae bacterium]|nr:response regulator [Phototrophicaceae bacterium]
MAPKILVIEDDVDIRSDIAEILEFEGLSCVVAPDGLTGTNAARQETPDLIICDVMMPGLDGYDVLRELRSDPQTVNIPFIFLTAKADRPSVRYGMEIGADDYLTKPFTPDELMKAIRTRLARKADLDAQYRQESKSLQESMLHALPHELRTPLFEIMGGADMLLMDTASLTPEDTTSLAQMIARASKRLQRLLENYLLYAQLEIISLDPSRSVALRQVTMDSPATLIREIATSKASLAGRSRDLRLNLRDGQVCISAENLNKVAEEILDNAFKFSKSDSPVTVSSGIWEGQYLLEVKDEGRGMSTEQIKRVGAFTQFGRELYEQQGVGLGLIIATRMVELHQGELSIRSLPEQGTRILIKLPIASRSTNF